MKNATAILVSIACALAASCSKPEPVPQTKPDGHTPTTPATAEPRRAEPSMETSPERIAEIEGLGRTGLWASVTEVCPQEVRSGPRTTLVWNVKGRAERVILYVVDPKDGQERHFGQGGPVGERESGPWLKPGLAFRIRDYDTKADLGMVEINQKSAGACSN